MLSTSLLVAAVLTFLVGAAHSWLGERKLIGPLLAPEGRQGLLAASGSPFNGPILRLGGSNEQNHRELTWALRRGHIPVGSEYRPAGLQQVHWFRDGRPTTSARSGPIVSRPGKPRLAGSAVCS